MKSQPITPNFPGMNKLKSLRVELRHRTRALGSWQGIKKAFVPGETPSSLVRLRSININLANAETNLKDTVYKTQIELQLSAIRRMGLMVQRQNRVRV